MKYKPIPITKTLKSTSNQILKKILNHLDSRPKENPEKYWPWSQWDNWGDDSSMASENIDESCKDQYF